MTKKSHFFSDPLCDDVISDDNDAGAGDEPEGVEAKEGVIEAALLGVVLQGEEGWVDEHTPACRPQHHLRHVKTFSVRIFLIF